MNQQQAHTLPEGWEIKLLDDVAKRGTGHTPDKEIDAYYNGGIKWVSLADSDKLDNLLISSTKVEISEKGLRYSSAVLHPAGTVLLSRDAGVGKSAIMGDYMAVSQHFVTWTCGDNINNIYLYYYLQIQKPLFERMAVGSTIKTIGLPFFKKLRIPLPPLPEQQQIAAILSTWDRAIEQTNALLGQLRARHRGLMQRLLTGKVRLPGFASEWRQVNANEVFYSVSIRNHPHEPLLSATQERGVIPRSMLEGRVVMPESETTSYKLVVPGDFIISLRSFQGGIECSDYRGIVSPAYTVLKPRGETNQSFYRHYFKSIRFIRQLGVAVIGIRDGKQISFDDFSSIRIPCPTVEEQQAIAAVLDTSLREIRQQEARLSSLREQKRGLMQNLLTGKVRVPLPAEVA